MSEHITVSEEIGWEKGQSALLDLCIMSQRMSDDIHALKDAVVTKTSKRLLRPNLMRECRGLSDRLNRSVQSYVSEAYKQDEEEVARINRAYESIIRKVSLTNVNMLEQMVDHLDKFEPK